MTREDANFILANIDRRVCDAELSEALDMAILALSLEPSIEAVRFWCRQNGYVMMRESIYEQDIRKAYFDGQNSGWIVNKCSNCGAINASVYRNYCPNCGAKMQEVDE